ncbi:MAG: ribulose-bisphosphate carboxylase [Gammaproteobacteria bacterium]|nr:ribulose-bisphosphate carboxylase [Gammaproteobacteria bacterium]
MDQSNRYADLSLTESELIANGKHLLVAYRLKPAAGYGFLEVAAHIAAESSTGTNVEVSTTDDFTRGVDALVYDIDEAAFGEKGGLMKVAYPVDLFDPNLIDGHYNVSHMWSLILGNNQGMGDHEGLRMLDFLVPEVMVKRFDGPATSIADLWKVLGRPEVDGGYIAGTIIKPKLGLRPEPFAKACYDFWLGGDFIKNDEPQANQNFCPMEVVIPKVAEAMDRAQQATGQAKLFSANVTADWHTEMIKRGEYVLGEFAKYGNEKHVAFLVDGFVTGPAGVTTSRRAFPETYLHFHRAGHGALTSYKSPMGMDPLCYMKLARLMGASGIHTGTMGYGKMEGHNDERVLAYMLERDECQGPYFYQKWYGMKPTTPIISGGMNALRLPGFFANLGHGNVINTCGGGAFGHIDSPAAGATSLSQAYDCWKSGQDPIEYAKTHKEFARAFESFPRDADKIYPNWREKLGVHK